MSSRTAGFLLALGCVLARPAPAAALPAFGHVVVVVEENEELTDVIGSTSMPYLNGLASNFGLAKDFFAVTHPSIGNYFQIAAGTVATNDDGYNQPLDLDNVVRQLVAAGKTWKAYAESIPSAGYTGSDVYPYMRRHNPLVFFTDVRNSPAQLADVVPFTQFAADLADGALPQYSFVSPNMINDLHDGTPEQADAWLRDNIAPLLANSQFQRDGLLIITFDEGNSSSHGGGNIPWIAVSPFSKSGYQSTTLYSHASTLRLSLAGLGVASFPNDSATAADMSEFFSLAVDSASPSAPPALTFGATTTSNNTNNWQASTDNLYVAGYLLDISQTADFSRFLPGDHDRVVLNSASYVASDLPPQTAFYARVRAVDPAGNKSAYSSTVLGTTGAAAQTVSSARAYPNPMRPSQGSSSMTFDRLPPGARVRVYDIKGALVEDLTADAAGVAVWGGRNRSGVPAATGVYFVYVQGGGQRATLKVAVQQ